MVPIYLIYCHHYAHATYMGYKYMKRGNITRNYLLRVLLNIASMDCRQFSQRTVCDKRHVLYSLVYKLA